MDEKFTRHEVHITYTPRHSNLNYFNKPISPFVIIITTKIISSIPLYNVTDHRTYRMLRGFLLYIHTHT